ncbi:MAG: MFS transporter [Sporomusaceae bacterium]|nr:MFS transporter [Sporomusaceae bacterium]
MDTTRLWTKNFILLVLANSFLFGGFHILLPTLPVYAAAQGANGSQIGLITGIFGFSAIFIRLFTDLGVEKLGKKKCLYVGLFISFLCTISYAMFNSVESMIITRIFHGIGFGLTTTFSAAIVADIIPASRRGEGIGYFGLGSTVAMALTPATGVWLMETQGFIAMFIFSALLTGFAAVNTRFCHAPAIVSRPVEQRRKVSFKDKLFEKGTGMPSLLTMLFGLSYGSINTFVAMLAQEAHIDNSGAFFVVGTICVFLSRPIGGKIFDAKGPAWIMIPGSILLFSALVILIQTHSFTLLLTAAVLYGFGGGLLLPALITWMLNIVAPDRRSAASATFYNMLDVGTSAGAILLGMVAEHIGFIKMYIFSAGAMALFLLFFVGQMVLTRKASLQQQSEVEWEE